MGLFDKLLSRKDTPAEQKSLSVPEGAAITEASDIEKTLADKSFSLRDCGKIPLTEIATLGGAFAQLVPKLRSVAQTVTVDGKGFLPINNIGDEALKQFSKDTPDVFVGSFKSAATGKSTMAKFIKAPPQTVSTTTVMPINPVFMAMAVMMVQMNQKLDAIQKTQHQIFSYLQEDKQARLQGNLNMLNDIIKQYPFNWNNEQFRSNYHVKALDIKQEAEQSIFFYQKQIADKIKAFPAVYLDQAVRDAMGKITDDFSDYRMALFLFSFASFLEVLLLGNFDQAYLHHVSEKVQEYQSRYTANFEQCQKYIKKASADSIETKVQDALGQAGKTLGELIGKTPVMANRSVDKWLIDSSNQLLKMNEDKTDQLVASFHVNCDTGSELFIDSIRHVDQVCHATSGVLFDQEYLYMIAR